MIKLLVVDDSALMRRQITQLFQAEGDFEVRQARNGLEALEENTRFQPDVVTLDINMPEMDGITALSIMMVQRPVPVVMVSSLTEQGALATFEALNLGALDYVAKPGGTISLNMDVVKADLLLKVRVAARSRLRPSKSAACAARSPVRGLSQTLREKREESERVSSLNKAPGATGVVLIGVSTGGPRALEDVLPHFPADFPLPIVVAQHMPMSFTGPFAERLNGICPLQVVEASRPVPVKPGTIYIARGGADLVLTRRATTLTAVPKPEASGHLWHPSVELLARSALEHVDPSQIIGVMLTGMGYDGADAFTEIKKRGGRTIAESEETAVVFGMPAVLIERGGASLVLSLKKIATQVKAWAAS